MFEQNHVEPQWVYVKNELHHVSEFAHLLPQNRPEAICPVCLKTVVLKLGSVRVHHYAHQADDICIITQPETALHYNTKFYIYKQLQNAQSIFTEQRCSGGCQKKQKQMWLQGWDAVEIEYTVASFRPDIALLSRGKVIGAIEIFVSHAVEEVKQQYFNDNAIHWLEVKADESLYSGAAAWTPAQAIPYIKRYPQAESWICPECAERKRQREIQMQKEREKPTVEIAYARMVDFYYPSGKKYREVYYIKRMISWQGELLQAWIENERHKRVATRKPSDNWLNELKSIVQNEIDENTRKTKATADDYFAGWREWVYGQKFLARATDKFPFRYIWDNRTSKWIRDEEGPSYLQF